MKGRSQWSGRSDQCNSDTFLARDNRGLYAWARLSPVRPSVALSVCLTAKRVDQSKTVEVWSMHKTRK